MGTSANLCVKHGDRHAILHTSYDAHPDRVIISLGATVAACGLDALRKHFSSCQIVSEDEASHKKSHRQAAAEGYLLACEARGQEAWEVDEFVNYPYGRPGFSHGGVIELFAPTIIDEHGFASPERADYTLDLDEGVLSYKAYDSHEDYKAGNPAKVVFSIDLNRLSKSEPDHIAHAFSDFDIDFDLPADQRNAEAQKKVEDIFQSLATPAKIQAEIDKLRKQNEGTERAMARLDWVDPSEKKPRTHVFSFHPQDVILLGGLSTMLMRNPELAAPGVVQFTPQPENEELSIVIQSPGLKVNSIMYKIGEAMRDACNYLSVGKDGSSSRITANAIMNSSGWIGDAFGGAAEDEGLSLPKNLTQAMTHEELLEKIPPFLQAQPDERGCYAQRLVSLLSLDAKALALLPFAPIDEQDKGFVKTLLPSFVKACDLIHGQDSAKAAFEAFDPQTQADVLSVLGPVHGRIFKSQRRLGM